MYRKTQLAVHGYDYRQYGCIKAYKGIFRFFRAATGGRPMAVELIRIKYWYCTAKQTCSLSRAVGAPLVGARHSRQAKTRNE